MINLTKEELIELYVNQNKTQTQIANMHNCKQYEISLLLKKYNIDKSPEQKRISKHQASLEKYGVINTSQLEEVKNKMKRTNIEKYGVVYATQSLDVQDKTKLTNLHKYGVSYSLQRQDIKDKIKQTNLNKYGCEYATQSEEVKRKISQTVKEKNALRIDNIITKEYLYRKYITENKTIKEISEITGIAKTTIQRRLQQYDIHKDDNIVNELRHKKMVETNLTRYGVKYPAQNVNILNSYINIDMESAEIVNDKETFIEYIKNNKGKTIQEIANQLHYSYSIIQSKIILYNLQEYVKYTTSTAHYEDEICQYLTELGINNIIRNTRDILSDKQEIDIYMPDYKFGIEFNGSYWHSEDNKPNDYHQKKSLNAKEHGIFIYNIFEYEWNNKLLQEKIKNQIKNILRKNNNKLYARQCVIKELNIQDKNDFLNENHIQGQDTSTIKLGLYYNDMLVSVMTFVKARFTKKYTWELSRYACRADYNVVGGASKLFKYFINNYLHDTETVLSYNDIGKTSGKLYETLGFVFDHYSAPNYIWWYDDNHIKTRYQCQMKNETQYMQNQGYVRIFDSGNGVWIYTK